MDGPRTDGQGQLLRTPSGKPGVQKIVSSNAYMLGQKPQKIDKNKTFNDGFHSRKPRVIINLRVKNHPGKLVNNNALHLMLVM